MKRALLTTLAVAGGLAVAVPVFAQQAGPGPQGPMMHRTHGDMDGRPDGAPGARFTRMCDDQDARQAGMLAYAEKRLKITDAQKAAWGKFTEAARASAQPMKAACDGLKDKPAPTNAIERLERMDTVMTARQTQMHQMLPAIKELYAQLSPDQQKVADDLLSHGPGHPGFGHGMRHERGPRGG